MISQMTTVDDVVVIIRRQFGGKLPDGAQVEVQSGLEELGLSGHDVTQIFLAIEKKPVWIST